MGSDRTPNVAMLSGEVSGDLVGGELARALCKIWPEVGLWGLGSRHMAEAGVELLFDSVMWGAIGIIESVAMIPRLLGRVLPAVLATLRDRRPDVVVLIDFGAFNMRVAHWCHARGIPVLYYFPPGSWRRSGPAARNKGLAECADRIATPFPWSAEVLRSVGASVEFVGHPLLDIVAPRRTRDAFAAAYGLDASAPIVGLLPGSRSHEVVHNTPAMFGAASLIRSRLPGAQFAVGVANGSAQSRIEGMLTELSAPHAGVHREPKRTGSLEHERVAVTPEGFVLPASGLDGWRGFRRTEAGPLPVVLCRDATYDVMAHSDVVLACSGTATLEAALLGTPMVILYRGSRLMALEYRLRRMSRIQFIGMPNIIAGRFIAPEYIAENATPESLAESAIGLLVDPEIRAAAKAGMSEVRAVLGQPGASERVARMVQELAGRGPVEA